MNIKKKFKKALKCGIGKAYFIVLENQEIDFSKQIKKAIISRFCYDGQVDGDRAYYLFKIINITRQRDELFQFVLKELMKEHDDWYVLTQLYEMAAILAIKGNKKAKNLIRNRFAKEVKNTHDWHGEDAILAIDGLKGLIKIARLQGKLLLKNPKWCESSFLVDHFQEKNPHIDAYQELEEASLQDAFVKIYLDAIKKSKAVRLNRKNDAECVVYNYDFAKEKIENDSRFVPYSWVKKLNEEDVRKIALDFKNETSIEKQERYLKIFSRIKFPLDYNIIFDIVKAGNESLIDLGCRALSFFKSKELRNFVLDKITANPKPIEYLPLLVSNFKKGDFLLLRNILSQLNDDEDIHNVNFIYHALYKMNQTTEPDISLKPLYEKLNCGACRFDMLSLFYNQNNLPVSVLEEMEYDSYEKTRDLFNEIKNKNTKPS